MRRCWEGLHQAQRLVLGLVSLLHVQWGSSAMAHSVFAIVARRPDMHTLIILSSYSDHTLISACWQRALPVVMMTELHRTRLHARRSIKVDVQQCTATVLLPGGNDLQYLHGHACFLLLQKPCKKGSLVMSSSKCQFSLWHWGFPCMLWMHASCASSCWISCTA